MGQSIAAARAATWHMLHNWVKEGAEEGDRSGSSSAKIESLFHELDVDESGALDYDEFKELLKRHGVRLSLSPLASIDVDGDGTVDPRAAERTLRRHIGARICAPPVKMRDGNFDAVGGQLGSSVLFLGRTLVEVLSAAR